jgi:hypothetical protein
MCLTILNSWKRVSWLLNEEFLLFPDQFNALSVHISFRPMEARFKSSMAANSPVKIGLTL